jgi:hypothetical protein
VAAEVVADEQRQCADVVELHVEQELCFIRRGGRQVDGVTMSFMLTFFEKFKTAVSLQRLNNLNPRIANRCCRITTSVLLPIMTAASISLKLNPT